MWDGMLRAIAQRHGIVNRRACEKTLCQGSGDGQDSVYPHCSSLCTGGEMQNGAARNRPAWGIVSAAGRLGAYVIIVLTALPLIRAASSPPPPLPCFAEQALYGQVTNPTGCGGTPNGKYTYSTTASPAQNKVSPPTQCQCQQTRCPSPCSYIQTIYSSFLRGICHSVCLGSHPVLPRAFYHGATAACVRSLPVGHVSFSMVQRE